MMPALGRAFVPATFFMLVSMARPVAQQGDLSTIQKPLRFPLRKTPFEKFPFESRCQKHPQNTLMKTPGFGTEKSRGVCCMARFPP